MLIDRKPLPFFTALFYAVAIHALVVGICIGSAIVINFVRFGVHAMHGSAHGKLILVWHYTTFFSIRYLVVYAPAALVAALITGAVIQMTRRTWPRWSMVVVCATAYLAMVALMFPGLR